MSDTSVVEMGEQGRVVIPASLRRELGLHKGSRLVARVDRGALVLVPRDAITERVRGLFAEVDRSLAEELIRDRRR
ncbi:MAG: AbrB/MazE/SpoVT family DNA-binding domain-containing protein, partial [Acidimicrobiia bacterium]